MVSGVLYFSWLKRHRPLVYHKRGSSKGADPAVIAIVLFWVTRRVDINEVKFHGVHVFAPKVVCLVTKVISGGPEVTHPGAMQRVVRPDLFQLHEDHYENPVHTCVKLVIFYKQFGWVCVVMMIQGKLPSGFATMNKISSLKMSPSTTLALRPHLLTDW